MQSLKGASAGAFLPIRLLFVFTECEICGVRSFHLGDRHRRALQHLRGDRSEHHPESRAKPAAAHDDLATLQLADISGDDVSCIANADIQPIEDVGAVEWSLGRG